jgi:heterodisulfide reductase subunit B
MKYTLFPGCKAAYFIPQYEKAGRLVLERFGIDIADLELTCCGYPIRFLDFRAFMFSAARNIALAGEKGLPLLCLCKCCYGTLLDADSLMKKNPALREEIESWLREDGLRYPEKVQIKHLLHVLFEEIDPTVIYKSTRKPFKTLRVAVHYGCHILRPRQVVQFDNPVTPSRFETLVEVTGAVAVDWSLRTQCCGDPLRGKNEELARALGKKKLASAKEAEADILCVGCTHCQMQFDALQQELLASGESELALPSLLYPQLLGLSLGLDPLSLGLPSHLPDYLAEKEGQGRL